MGTVSCFPLFIGLFAVLHAVGFLWIFAKSYTIKGCASVFFGGIHCVFVVFLLERQKEFFLYSTSF